MQRERIIVTEDGADLSRDVVTREPAPLLALMPVFEAVGSGRGEWEAARAVEVEYIAPGERAA